MRRPGGAGSEERLRLGAPLARGAVGDCVVVGCGCVRVGEGHAKDLGPRSKPGLHPGWPPASWTRGLVPLQPSWARRPPTRCLPPRPALSPLQVCYCCFAGGRLQSLYPFPTWLRWPYRAVSQLSGSQRQGNFGSSHMHGGCLWGGGYLGGARGGLRVGVCSRLPPHPAPTGSLPHTPHLAAAGNGALFSGPLPHWWVGWGAGS